MRTDISTLNTQRYDDMESYGGLVGGMPIASRVPAIPATIGKRSNRTDQDPECQDDDDEERRKRSRGRPRLDTKDETAADVSITVNFPDCLAVGEWLHVWRQSRRTPFSD